jgi:hypothetical protein
MRALRLWTAAAAGPVVAADFYTLAVLRNRRSLHQMGIGYQGWLRVPNEWPPRPGAPLFQAGATHQALLRFSRGAGLPEPLPDALGVAIKLPDAHGPGVDQDLLLTSSTDRPLLRRLLFPATSFVRGAFSTALPYDLGHERIVLLLVPAPISAGPSTGGNAARCAPRPRQLPLLSRFASAEVSRTKCPAGGGRVGGLHTRPRGSRPTRYSGRPLSVPPPTAQPADGEEPIEGAWRSKDRQRPTSGSVSRE